MSSSNKYVLDANVFIQAKNQYYGFSICPGYWKSLVLENRNKRVFSIDRVYDELIEEHDELSAWAAEEVPPDFFKQTQDKAVIDLFQEMVASDYAEPQFTDAAKTEFASAADGWVMAYAKANRLAVVTHEEYRPEAKSRVPMPNICVEFNIEYQNTFTMLEQLHTKFVLSTKTPKSRKT